MIFSSHRCVRRLIRCGWAREAAPAALQVAVDREGGGGVGRFGPVAPCFGETGAEIFDLLMQCHNLGPQIPRQGRDVVDAGEGRVQPDDQDDTDGDCHQLDERPDRNQGEPSAEDGCNELERIHGHRDRRDRNGSNICWHNNTFRYST